MLTILQPSTDGVSVPITLIHRKGLSRNGDNPCLLFGYGAYGSVEDMDYQMPISSLVQRGLVYAVGSSCTVSLYQCGYCTANAHSYHAHTHTLSLFLSLSLYPKILTVIPLALQ